MPDCGASDQAGNDSVASEELQELKEENRRLRKSLTLLHTYSLRIQEQRDTLLVHRNKLLDAWEAVAGWMRKDYRADEQPGSLVGQIDQAHGEFPHQEH